MFVLFAVIIAVDALFPMRYYGYVKKYCKECDIDCATVLAVIWTESKFVPSATSGAGARGLMQLMPSTAMWVSNELNEVYDEDRLFEPEYNIRLGVYYLSYLSRKFEGDYILAAYNAGEGNVKKWKDEIPFPETRDYIKKVNMIKKIYSLRVG